MSSRIKLQDRVDAGSGVELQPITLGLEGEPDPSAIIVWHRKQNGNVCASTAYLWNPPGWKVNVWTILDGASLTLSPSFVCGNKCGLHGFIRDGRWISV